MPPISVLLKPVSGRCNMSCEYCFYQDETRKRTQESFGFMSEETLKNVIRKTILRSEGMISYAFQGGEPTLRGIEFFRKAVELQKKYNRNNIRVTNAIQTNGLLLNEEWCQFFKENNFLVGVSVDGTKQIHDKLRHTNHFEDTFEKVLYGIGLLEQYKVDYNILTVVSRDVAENIEEIYQFYKDKGWSYQQYIACLDPLGEEHGKHPYSLEPEEYGRFLTKLFDLWYEDYKKGQQPFIRQFENYAAIIMGYVPESCNQRGSCSVQNVVEADGSVYPCDFYMLDEYKIGNFNEDRLEDILNRGMETDFTSRSRKNDRECQQCMYYKICRGGCFRNRDYQERTGEYRNYFCKGYLHFFDSCLERLEQMCEEVKNRKRQPKSNV